MEMKYTLRPNTWLINGIYIYSLELHECEDSQFFLWPIITRNISYRIYRMAFKNRFPIAFNYSEICDCSVFNLNHYLLLSYSRMIKVIKRNIIWDISSIFTFFLQSFKCLKEYFF